MVAEFVAGLGLSTAIVAQAAERRAVTHEDLWLLPRVAAPAVSPGGKNAVFSVTDPSYTGQIVTMTASHIGNYGLNDADAESDARWEAVRAEMSAPSWGRQRSRAVLQMPSVCRAGGDAPMSTATFAAVVFEQTPRATDVWLADGSPTTESWAHLGWRSAP